MRLISILPPNHDNVDNDNIEFMSEPEQQQPAEIPEPEPSIAEPPMVQEALTAEEPTADTAPTETAAPPPTEALETIATSDEASTVPKIPTRATTSIGDLTTLPRPSSEAQLVNNELSGTAEPMEPEAEQESADASFRPGRVAFLGSDESNPEDTDEGLLEAERTALERTPTPFALDVARDESAINLMDSTSTEESFERNVPSQPQLQENVTSNEVATASTTNAAAASSSPYPDEYSMLDPDHPLMARVQEALLRQLTERNIKLENEAREKMDMLKKSTGRRETIGVTLYQSQQQLARLQAILDQSQGKYEQERTTREDAEQKTKKMTESHRKEMESLRDREERCMFDLMVP